MKTIKQSKQSAGFTLVEVLIAMAVFSIVLGAVYAVFTSNMKAYVSQETALELSQELRAALNLMTTEIRMAGYDPEDTGGVGFIEDTLNEPDDDRYNTDGNSIRFTMDINDAAGTGQPDGDVNDSGEDVNYYVAPDANGVQCIFRRLDGDDTTEALVAENITNLTFTYFDEDNLTTSTLADIRSVVISLTGKSTAIDPLRRKHRTQTETTRIKVRNMGIGT